MIKNEKRTKMQESKQKYAGKCKKLVELKWSIEALILKIDGQNEKSKMSRNAKIKQHIQEMQKSVSTVEKSFKFEKCWAKC